MENENGFQFERLQVYQRSLDIVDMIYQITEAFPKDELFGLRSQFRRAVVSINLNIAEGSARSKKDFRRFLDVVHGSVFECIAILTICKRRNFIIDKDFSQIRMNLSELSKMISGLKRSIGFERRCDSLTTNSEL